MQVIKLLMFVLAFVISVGISIQNNVLRKSKTFKPCEIVVKKF